MIVTRELLDQLKQSKIYLQRKRVRPNGKNYGWLSVGQTLPISRAIRVEQRCGLFGGPYVPSKGGYEGSGFFPMGSFSYSYSALPEEVSVGRYCSISSGLALLDSHHPLDMVTTSAVSFRPKNPIFKGLVPRNVLKRYPFEIRGPKPYPVIEHDVWIGRDVTLGMGVTLGTGCVVAAGSMVTKDVDPYTIVGGNPAKVIRRRFSDAVCEDLLRSRWWRYGPDVILGKLPADDPSRLCRMLAEAEEAGSVTPYSPEPFVLLHDSSPRQMSDEEADEDEFEDAAVADLAET